MKRALTLIMAMMMLVFAIPVMAAENGEYYVYTENGKALNVRSRPNGDIVGTIKSGSKVQVDSMVNDSWARITFEYDNGKGVDGWPAYVNRRFLTREDPAEVKETEGAVEFTGDPLLDMNQEFLNAKKVEPYTVIARPTRVSSWVSLRWIPGSTGMIIATYPAGEKLTVLKELCTYYMVQNPTTGDVGYVEKMLTVQQDED